MPLYVGSGTVCPSKGEPQFVCPSVDIIDRVRRRRRDETRRETIRYIPQTMKLMMSRRRLPPPLLLPPPSIEKSLGSRGRMIGQTIGRTKLRIGLQICILMTMQSRGESADNSMVEHPECRLYLAESTIPHGACIALNNNCRLP